ncbi:MAG TPA: adenylate/guanylate cyclase domain-containing protein [Burkholderiales bacterium]|nr:adenylate/guanylate cyclase domain-containing protein [Burkholderiales bacterium]
MDSERPSQAWIRPLRLWCGLILFAYLLTHFSNHALGLISLGTMEAARIWFLALWRNPVAEWALLGALLAHWLLGLWLIFQRRTLRMPAWEAMQIIFGLAVPPLLTYHLVGTRLANAMFGTEDLYARVILNIWVLDYWAGIRQWGLFTLAWTHGCIGIHFWLRIRKWYAPVFPFLLMTFILLPALAFLGVAEAGREVSALAREPGFVKRLDTEVRAPSAVQRATLAQVRDGISIAVWALLGLTLAARVVRQQISRRRSSIRINYPGGREVHVPVGWTVLEASRSAGIPHASVCGGRGRCSTCRVRIAGDPTLQPKPSPLERRVLERIGAPPNVRLACQLRPSRDLVVTPLLQAAVGIGAAHAPPGARDGEERQMAVLFADLRGFTRMAERKLPYDVVFILNRYFEAVGGAVAQAGGIANQYTGDGVMALFGIEAGLDTACRQAILASGAMIDRVEALSRALGGELVTPLRLGIGIHAGPVVVGDMGYGGTHYLTAVGDTVNTASRLEGLTKEYGCELVVSEEVVAHAKLATADYPHHELTLRNREAPLRVVVVENARRLAGRMRAADGAQS